MRWGAVLLCLAPTLACSGETVSEKADGSAPTIAVPSSGGVAADAGLPRNGETEPSVQPPGSVPATGIEGVGEAGMGAPGPTDAYAPPSQMDATPPAEAGVLWTSDDGPILGLAIDADRVFCVTQSKLVSVARDGTDPRVLAQSPDRFAYSGAIATNGVAVYWGVGSSSGGVSAISPDGGASVSLGAEGYATVGIALDESRVYWMTNDSVMTAPLGGSGMATLATLAGLSYENAFTLVDGMLYWSTNDSAVGPATAGVFRMPAMGGTASMIAPGPVFSLEPTGTGAVAWLENPTPVVVENASAQSPAARIALPGTVSEFATDGARWVWRDDRTGTIYAIAGAGGTASPLTQASANATPNNGDGRHILVDQGQVFWADRTEPPSQAEVNVLRMIRLTQ